jgi:hypothetical protein
MRHALANISAHSLWGSIRVPIFAGGGPGAVGRCRLGVRDDVIFFELVQDLGAVGRDRVVAQTFDNGRVLALLYIEQVQRGFFARQSALDHRRRDRQVEQSIVARLDSGDVGSGYGGPIDTLHQAVQVDLHRLARPGLPARPAALGVLGFALILGSAVAGLGRPLVGTRRKRRRHASGQRRHVDARHLQRGDIEFGLTESRVHVAGGQEVQVPAIRVEHREKVVGERLTDPGRFAGVHVVEPDPALLIGCGHAVGDPPAVGGPGVVMDLVVGVTRDLSGFAPIGRDDPQPMLVVGKGEPIASRRPARRIEVAAGEMGQHAFRPTLGGARCDLLLAARIGRVRDRLAVRRPARMVLVGTRALGQVARVAEFGRDREQIPTCREYGPLAAGREVEIRLLRHVLVANLPAGVHPMRARARSVVGNRHLQLVHLFGRQVQHVQLAAFLKHDPGIFAVGRAQARKIDVVVREVRHLPKLAAHRVEGPQVRAAVRVVVGQEVDRLPVPHRTGFVPRPVGHMRQFQAREIVDVDILGQPALVALPGAEIAKDPIERDLAAVRAVAEKSTAVQRHRLRQSAVDRYRE